MSDIDNIWAKRVDTFIIIITLILYITHYSLFLFLLSRALLSEKENSKISKIGNCQQHQQLTERERSRVS